MQENIQVQEGELNMKGMNHGQDNGQNNEFNEQGINQPQINDVHMQVGFMLNTSDGPDPAYMEWENAKRATLNVFMSKSHNSGPISLVFFFCLLLIFSGPKNLCHPKHPLSCALMLIK